MNIAPNRAVAVLTPLVFAPLAGAVSVLIARYGVDIDGASLQAVFITGATIGFAKAGIWLKGWQEHEKHQEVLEPDVPDAGLAVGVADNEPDLEPDDGDGDELDLEPDLDFETDDEEPVLAGVED